MNMFTNERLRRSGWGALWGGLVGFLAAVVLLGIVWPFAFRGRVTFLDVSIGILSGCMAAPVGAVPGFLAGLIWRGKRGC
jgi:hypothetical protein